MVEGGVSITDLGLNGTWTFGLFQETIDRLPNSMPNHVAGPGRIFVLAQ